MTNSDCDFPVVEISEKSAMVMGLNGFDSMFANSRLTSSRPKPMHLREMDQARAMLRLLVLAIIDRCPRGPTRRRHGLHRVRVAYAFAMATARRWPERSSQR